MEALFATFADTWSILRSILRDVTALDIVDILVVSFGIYRVLLLIEGTRAFNLLKGLALLLLLLFFTRDLDLHSVNLVLSNTLPAGFLALVVIFQPELRRALEDIGRGSFIGEQLPGTGSIPQMVEEIVKTVETCSKKRIGALIVFEQDIGLKDFIMKGVQLHAYISREMLSTIFMPFTPLHDGAVIIKGSYIEAASCILPITSNIDLARELGTRHRAAVGISEISDAMVLVVSEETGTISLAKSGKIVRNLTVEKVRDLVRSAFTRMQKSKRFFPFLP